MTLANLQKIVSEFHLRSSPDAFIRLSGSCSAFGFFKREGVGWAGHVLPSVYLIFFFSFVGY